MTNRLLLATILLAAAGLVQAAGETVDLESLPDAPPPPDPVESGEPIEPDVTIIQKAEETIEEYRINGHLYMVKVTPNIGKPYYLLDSDGDGRLEARMSEIYSDFVVPKWVLFSW